MSDSSTDPRRLLLYAVLDAAARDDDALHTALSQAGGQEASLSILACGALSVLVSPVGDPAALRDPDVDRVLAYNDIIETGYAVRRLLPLRFGTQAESLEAARRLVRHQSEACQNQLAYLEGRVEMGVRLQGPPASQNIQQDRENTEAASGTAYLQARKEAQDRTQRPLRQAGQLYVEALGNLCDDASYDALGPDDHVLSIAFLVPRCDADLFIRRADDVQPPSGVQDVQVVGPWAPFTFASLPL